MRPVRLLRHQAGTTTVEFCIVAAVFLFMFLAALEFCIDFFWIKGMEKAAQQAVRMAVVSDAAKAVPDANEWSRQGFVGQACRNNPSPCSGFDPVVCTGTQCDGTGFGTILQRIQTILPTIQAGNVRITYAYYDGLGFAGGPTVPVVTVELVNVPSPLGAIDFFAPLLGGSAGNATLPTARATLTGEDMSSAAAE